MPSALQTTSTPINGKEARKLLELEFKRLLDATPQLDLGTSYHRFTLSGNFRIGAYPADTPTPVREFEINIDSPTTKNGDNNDHFAKIKLLETQREELVARLQELTELLDVANPVTESNFELAAGDTPDRLRIENGLPIPVVQKVSGKHVETYVGVTDRGGKFQFGKKEGES